MISTIKLFLQFLYLDRMLVSVYFSFKRSTLTPTNKGSSLEKGIAPSLIKCSFPIFLAMIEANF